MIIIFYTKAVPVGLNRPITLTATIQKTTATNITDNTKCKITIDADGLSGTILFRNDVDGMLVDVGDKLIIYDADHTDHTTVVRIIEREAVNVTVDADTGIRYSFSMVFTGRNTGIMEVPHNDDTLQLEIVKEDGFVLESSHIFYDTKYKLLFICSRTRRISANRDL